MFEDTYLIQIFDSFPDAVVISDKHGFIRFVNQKHSLLTGIPADKMLNKHVLDLVREKLFDNVLNPDVVSFKKKITRLQTKADGKKLVLEGYPIFDANKNVAYVATFMRDITTLAEMQEQIAAQNELLMAFHELQQESPTQIINSKAMRSLYAKMEPIAQTDASILLLGETGVGKDVLAHAIHSHSPRVKKAFIKIDCGSIPENLIETELFGYAPGSFSGANKNGKIGLIEAADNGTLFLDEIWELPLTMQTRFLRFLQDKEVTRVGATVPNKVDARIIAATNKNLEKEVQKGTFRGDLYYRLKVAVFEIPPLRKRLEDILPLANSFLTKYGTRYGKKVHLSPQAEEALLQYHWPGNVRELANMIQSLVVSTNKTLLSPADFPFSQPHHYVHPQTTQGLGSFSIEGKTYKQIMQEVEAIVIEMGVQQYGSVAEAARHFQVNRSTLFRKKK